jgi:hypothetical protein
VAEIPEAAFMVRFVFLPVIVLSGFWLWLGLRPKNQWSAETAKIDLVFANESCFVNLAAVNTCHMIPAITPPTDNLYKFVALFGLTIFLFAMYNLEIVVEHSTKNKVHIESIKVDLQKRIYERTKLKHASLTPDATSEKFRPVKIKWLDTDLKSIERVVNTSNLTFIEKIEFKGQLSGLNARLDTLKIRQTIYVICVLAGVVVMVLGFLFWKRKEQDLRDKILDIEHTIKQLERESKAKKKKKKHKAADTQTIVHSEKPAIEEPVNQN